MSIMDKFKNAVDTSPHQKEVTDRQGQCAKLEADANALHRQIAEAKTKLEDAALDAEASGNRKAYDAINRQIGELQIELSIKLVAAAAAQKKVSAAKQALHVAQTADRERKATEFGKRRDKYTVMAAEAIATLHRAHKHIVELGREAAEDFGAELTTRHAGTMISTSEWLHALEVEIARVSSPGILPPTMSIPALPGGRIYTLGGNPANAAPLVEVMTKANAELVRRITARPLAETKAEAPPVHSEPVVAADIDDAILNPNGPTLSADQIQASLGRRRMS